MTRLPSAQAEVLVTGRPPITVEQYVTQWLDGLSSRLRPKTVRSYRDLYRIHIGPPLGATRLTDLQRPQVKMLLIDKKRQGLSRNTVRLIGACLSSICSEAIDDGLITSNPAIALGRWLGRSRDGNARADGKTFRTFSEAELGRVLEAARETCPRYYPLFLALARTGCRPGEALALRWSDVAFERREIRIERALSAGHIGPTKTGRSRRVDMSQELASVLGELRNDRETVARRNGSRDLAEWVFVGRDGNVINEDWPRRVFAKVLVRAGLSGHTPYDLRHTFATLHLAKGHPITYVSAQLGHADPSTTLRWYAHWLPISDKRYADSLDGPGFAP